VLRGEFVEIGLGWIRLEPNRLTLRADAPAARCREFDLTDVTKVDSIL